MVADNYQNFLHSHLAGQGLELPLLLLVLVVYAAADLGIEEGQGRHGVGGLLPELCLPDLHDEGALEVSVLLALQIKAPEVPEPLLAVPVLNSPTGSRRT